jgi:hypothetical protein
MLAAVLQFRRSWIELQNIWTTIFGHFLPQTIQEYFKCLMASAQLLSFSWTPLH